MKAITPMINYEIHETFSFGIIYIYSIPDSNHQNRLKIGGATVGSISPTQEDIDLAAHTRIKQQTKTADILYKLEHAELAITNNKKYFSDYDVHEVLIRSGFERKSENTKNTRSEWFEVDLNTAINAIKAVKEGRKSLSNSEINNKNLPFPFRPNQLEAISKTNKAIRQNRKHFLWNAKMRFGKTSAALQVAKENGFKKVLIVTHRPSVSDDWYNDFNNVLGGTEFEYSSKTKGENIAKRIESNTPFVYFASLQDLRLSQDVVSDESSGSKSRGFDKNHEIFDTKWDFLIIDEAHEGTQSNLGDSTLTKIPNNFMLELSGTPFNIIHKREEDEVYTWDYVMEQYEKINWDRNFPGIPNPYAELPSLSMFTYDIDKYSSSIGNLSGFKDQLNGAFKFHEFFRVMKDSDGNETSQLVHEDMVIKFFDLLVNDKSNTKFPFSTELYRTYNKHSLWLLPNRTKVIEAVEKLLKQHPIFSKFGIVNISGDAKKDDALDSDAKSRVSSAIKNNDYTITLTGQRLTTGASIPEWTAVFMLSDTSSATTYLQTAFRCQTPAKIDGKLKTQGYIFDFAPDRTLKLIAETIELNHKSGKINSPEQKQAMSEFLNFCPIIAADDGSMKPYDVSTMLGQLKKAIIDRVSINGFDDPKLYNDELLKLNDIDIEKFNNLKKIIGSSTNEQINEININDHGMNQLETDKAEEAERKKKQKQPLSEEEKELLKQLKEAREQKNNAISILRAVSIRMPMMVYGANVSIREDITLEKFIEIVDDESWLEFMPSGLSKDGFREFTKYYDEEVFRGVTRNIRAKAFDSDSLLPTERIQAIAELFGTFKNPDKETVLTPWNIVNMQISNTLGGNDFRTIISRSGKPEWRSQGEVTDIWSHTDSRILDINSKSGLYPLLAAYNIYTRELIKLRKPEDKAFKQLWREIIARNIFVLCKSPMAVTITRRTLLGYSNVESNVIYIQDLIKKLRQENQFKGYNLNKEIFEKFRLRGDEVKFTAVIGNPPYQINDNGKRDDGKINASASPIYNLFIEESIKISKLQSLIIPARWTTGAGKGLSEFTKMMLNDKHIRAFVLHNNSRDVFPTVDIKGGICYFLRDENYNGEAAITVHSGDKTDTYNGYLNSDNTGSFIPYSELQNILKKIIEKTPNLATNSIQTITSVRKPYGLSTDFFKNPKKYGLPEIDETTKLTDDIEIIGLDGAKRAARYVRNDYPLTIGQETTDKWKMFIPYAYGSGLLGELGGLPMLGAPRQICTETFLRIGSFNSSYEAENLIKYYKTKLFRTLVGILKTTQHATTTFKYVPIQDFTHKSDIDWSLKIAQIDKQLYAKYKLSEEEISFIETHVKAME